MENYPVLISCKPLKGNYEKFRKIPISSNEFSLGRSLSNSSVIPFLSISRHHCLFKKDNDGWTINDNSAFGVEINGDRLGRGKSYKLNNDDIITLEPSKEFIYKFYHPNDDLEVPRKRIKLENTNEDGKTPEDGDLLNNVKLKFEESQNYEIKHIETKIESAKQIQNTNVMLKEQLQLTMDKKIQELETHYAGQIENLQGEKNEVSRQRELLLVERDTQLAGVRLEMERKIQELQNQIKENRQSETELMKLNEELKEKLKKEREEFLAEISRENSSKQELMERLEAKIKEQEQIRVKERQKLQEETEQLRLAKEKELIELEERTKQRELELTKELDTIKKTLEEQVSATEAKRLVAEEQLRHQVEQMQKLNNEEKVKMEQMLQEREQIQQKLAEAESQAQKAAEELQLKIQQRETELATLAAERIQLQADQSGQVISALQDQLEQVRSQLHSAESEKNTLMEWLEDPGASTSRQARDDTSTARQHDSTSHAEAIMDNEFQCSICAETFIEATTLGCSHTFCKYCITKWKTKKKDCPICRTPIKSECRSLALDTFIEKMTETTDEAKAKRMALIEARRELERVELPRDRHASQGRRRRRRARPSTSSSSSSSDRSTSPGQAGGGAASQAGEEVPVPSPGEDSTGTGTGGTRGTTATGTTDDEAIPTISSSDEGSGTDDDFFYDGWRDGEDQLYDELYDEHSFGGHSGSNAGTSRPSSQESPSGSDDGSSNAGSSDRTERSHGFGGRRRRRGGRGDLPHNGEDIPGLGGYYYGGYGYCYYCGATGHWAPGCPFR